MRGNAADLLRMRNGSWKCSQHSCPNFLINMHIFLQTPIILLQNSPCGSAEAHHGPTLHSNPTRLDHCIPVIPLPL